MSSLSIPLQGGVGIHALAATNANVQCSPLADNAFGPQVDTCRRSFDFTLLFEESILSIAPSVLLLFLAPIRIVLLHRQPTKLRGGTFQKIKLLALVSFAIVQLAIVVVACVASPWRTRTSIAAAVLAFVDACIFCLLSYSEHTKSIRPSAILGTYLFFSLLFDVVRARTLWMIPSHSLIAPFFTTSVALKVVVLLLEARGKTSYLSSADKDLGPEETSGIFSQSLFWWLNGLILQGFRKLLLMDDLYPLDEKLTSNSVRTRFWRVWDTSAKTGKYPLLFALLKSLRWPFIVPMLPRFVLLAFTFCQPLLITRFLKFLGEPNTADTRNVGYGLIGAYALVYIGIAISTGFYNHQLYRFITMVRGTLVVAIYRKTTEISITALDNSAAVTLMSADVERIVQGLRFIHDLWANLVSVGLATFLLYRQLGVAALVPIAVAVLTAGATVAVSKGAVSRQVAWVKVIQERVGVTSTMLSSMKGVKMSGLTGKLSTVIQTLRLKEITAGTKFRMALIYGVILAFVPMQIAPVLTFATFSARSKASHVTLDTNRVFTSLSLLQLLAEPLMMTFQTLPTMSAAFGCLQRIQVYLLTETRSDHRLEMSNSNTPPSESVVNPFQTPTNRSEIELTEIKPTFHGTAAAKGASEVVVVRNGTFGWKEDSPVLQDVNLSIERLKLTVLVGPIASGKSTLLKAILGETPSSKGFVYVSSTDVAFCDQTPWLINATIRKNIIAFSDFDRDWYQAVVYASGLEEDLATFVDGDQTLIGSAGISLSGGQRQRVAIARAVYARKEVAIFDDVFSGFDMATEKLVFDRVFGPAGLLRLNRTTIILATHSQNILPFADRVIGLRGGTVVEQGLVSQSLVNEDEKELGPTSETSSRDTEDGDTSAEMMKIKSNVSKNKLDAANNAKQRGDISVYKYYFQSIGTANTVVFFAIQIAFTFLLSFPSVWLKWWSDANNKHPNEQTAMFLGVYALLQVLGILAIACLGWHVFYVMIARSGSSLHRKILDTVMAAPMLFFSTTDTGVTTNRFSQDIQIVDMELPNALLNAVANGLGVIASAGLISSASYYIAICFPAIAIIFYFIQKYYLRTSRQLRFMDLEAKSPLYSQFIESLSGLATIRAFQWQRDNLELNQKLLDSSQQPFYLLFMVQRWLTLVLDLLGAGLAVFVVTLAVKLKDTVNPGFTGVALVNLINFTENLKYLILVWTMLETSIGAVSRIKSFEAETPGENLPGEDHMPPPDWPRNGEVEINGISASYKPDSEFVLNDFSLSIKAGEKIGICGRSGSGKSSLVLALARMIELSAGTLIIDGLNLALIPRQSIRSCLNIIPQDPYFLHGTIRLNLDPDETATSEKIIAALERADLWGVIQEKGGLDAQIDVNSFSHGQRQLFCLVRAMLRPGRILILDEATSSVDTETDDLMQKIIREEFSSHTIIAIAHRIGTVCDFDRVAVLDEGRLLECDNPQTLLARKSAFRDLFEMYRTEGSKKTDDNDDVDVEKEVPKAE